MAGKRSNGRKKDTADLTLEVLGKIHAEMTGMRGDVRDLGTRLDQTNQRLDQTNQRLERVEQGLLDLGTFMKQLALELTGYQRFHAHHVEILGKDVQDLRERLLRVEDRLPR